jgi:hypothetical protein
MAFSLRDLGRQFAQCLVGIVLGTVPLPGWAAILMAIFLGIPAWSEAVRFWLDTAKSTGGWAADVAPVLTNPYFPPALGVFGLLYLLIVGYPGAGLVRHRIVPIVGWLCLTVCFATVFVTAGSGYFELRVREEASKVALGIPRGTPNENNSVRPQKPLAYDNRTLQPDQIRILLEELPRLRPIQSTITFSLDQSDNEPLSLYRQYHEIFTRSGLFHQMLYQLPRGPEDVGTMIEVRDIRNVPAEAQKLREAFDVASIYMPIVQMPDDFAKAYPVLAYAIYIGPAPIH